MEWNYEQHQGDLRHPAGVRGSQRTGVVDTNGDRALSLEEVQAVHARMFQYADADSDGKLTLEEVQGFFRGGGHPGKR
jgi:hypothetical protein